MSTTLRASLGVSHDESAFTAGCAAAREAVSPLGPLAPRLALVLATPHYHQEQLLEGVRSLIQTTPLVGGSTPLLLTSRGLETRGVGVLLLGADALTCLTAADALRHTDRRATASLAAQLLARTNPRSRRTLLLLAHPRTALSRRWLQSLQQFAGRHVPIVGGVLAAPPRDASAALYLQATVLTDGVVGALVCGDVQVGVGSAHGWHPLGAPHQTTRTEGRLVRTLDGMPAAGLYREYFGEPAVQQAVGETLPRLTATYPLGVSMAARAPEVLVRSVRQITEEGALDCLGEVPEGAWVRLMIASRPSVVAAATRAASLAISRLRQVRCAWVWASVARRRMLGDHAADELAALQRVLGPHTPLLGGLTEAELAPRQHGARLASDIQNDAISVIALGH